MKAPPLARQGLVFLAVGGAATLVHLTVALLSRRAGLGPLGANLAGYVCAVGVSYLGNLRLTFGAVAHGAQFIRFVVMSLAGLALNQAITFVTTHLLGAPFAVALALVVTVVPAMTFALARLWVFRAANDA